MTTTELRVINTANAVKTFGFQKYIELTLSNYTVGNTITFTSVIYPRPLFICFELNGETYTFWGMFLYEVGSKSVVHYGDTVFELKTYASSATIKCEIVMFQNGVQVDMSGATNFKILGNCPKGNLYSSDPLYV